MIPKYPRVEFAGHSISTSWGDGRAHGEPLRFCEMPKKRSASGKAKQQVSLEQVNLLPVLKKPMTAVGKELKVPGHFWGESCAPGDKDKVFRCVVMDFQLAHRMTKDASPGAAFVLHEMGEDGAGGNSDDFWVQYPMPFLTVYYDTYPDEKAPQQVVHPAQPTEGNDATTVAGEAENTDCALTPRSSIYQHMDFLSSEKRRSGHTASRFTCRIAQCGGSITIFGKSSGPFFKHLRRISKKCPAHATVLEELNALSSRQVGVHTLRVSSCTPFRPHASHPHPCLSGAAHKWRVRDRDELRGVHPASYFIRMVNSQWLAIETEPSANVLGICPVLRTPCCTTTP